MAIHRTWMQKVATTEYGRDTAELRGADTRQVKPRVVLEERGRKRWHPRDESLNKETAPQC